MSWSYEPDVDRRGTESYLVVYENCADKLRIVIRLPDGRFTQLSRQLEVSSFEGTHVLRDFGRYRGNNPGWVESFVWTFFEVEEGKLVLSHMRSVNNRSYPANDPLRYYFAYGTGVLQKSKEACGKPLE